VAAAAEGHAPPAQDDGDDHVLLVIDGPVAEIRLNRPDRLNAVDNGMLEAFAAHLETLRADPSVRVVLLTGAGRAFCAGGDLKRPPRTGPLPEQTALLRRQAATVETLAALPQATVAVLGGACAGLAVGWAAACTLRVMSETAVLNTGYLAAGLSGDFGVAWWLHRTVGPSVAADWMLRPRKISAADCAAHGFATLTCPPQELADTVAGLTAQLLGHRPAALAAALANLRLAATGPALSGYLDLESERHVTVRQAAVGTGVR
jgi:2-(1,2-epoxy-1,2-dihydrophenyl)acetyl-CoA isomerase